MNRLASIRRSLTWIALATSAAAPGCVNVAIAQTAPALSGPTILDFTASWCGPCRQVAPAVRELSRAGYPVRAIDVGRDKAAAGRYGVTAVPTFVVVDGSGRELARTGGVQSAQTLAGLYNGAVAKSGPVRSGPDQSGLQSGSESANPHPARTTVRIRIIAPGSIGYGSGTVVYSDAQQSVILTCAHIFKLDGQRQAQPARFPHRIAVDLFDGRLVGTNPARVGYLETVRGQAVDYDFGLDVGLIRIRPGRALPYSHVVPTYWRPVAAPRPMVMLTVGCAEGNDATAWYTKIVNPSVGGVGNDSRYEAIECQTAPRQGRSGCGLFTTDYFVAGVCDFAEPRGNTGLYASPRSIHAILSRNGLASLYDPACFRFYKSKTVVIGGPPPAPAEPPYQPPAPMPAPPPIVMPPPSGGSTIVDINGGNAPAPTVDLSEIYRRLDSQQTQINQQAAGLQRLASTPITFVTPQPDGTQAAQSVKLGEKIGFKIPDTSGRLSAIEARLDAIQSALPSAPPPSPISPK